MEEKERSLKTSAAKVLYKRFALRELVRGRQSAEERNNIVPRRDSSGELPGGAPPAAFLETKRKLEETGGDWFRPVRGREASRRDPLRFLKRARGSSGIHE